MNLDASNFSQLSSADDSDTASVDTEPVDPTHCLEALLTMAAADVPRKPNRRCGDTETGQVKRRRVRDWHKTLHSTTLERIDSIVLAARAEDLHACCKAIVLPHPWTDCSAHDTTSHKLGASVLDLSGSREVLRGVLSAFADAEIIGATSSSLNTLKHELSAARHECMREVEILHMEEMVHKVVKEAGEACKTICDALKHEEEEEEADNNAAQILSDLRILM